MSKNPETIFKERVYSDIRKLGFFEKTQQKSKSGIPDFIGCINGRFVAIELKIEEGRLDEIQYIKLKEISSAGGFAVVAFPDTWLYVLEELKQFSNRNNC